MKLMQANAPGPLTSILVNWVRLNNPTRSRVARCSAPWMRDQFLAAQPVRSGTRPARIFFFVILGLTAIVMLAPYLLDYYRPIYAYIVALGVFPVAYYVMVRVHHERTGPQLERLSQLLKYDFLIWFAAVLLGAAV